VTAKRLIRVMKGLYRSEDGNLRVAYQLRWQGKPAHWLATWTTWFGTRATEEFRTLREVREWYKRH
jgi:hypothetical protein